MRHGYTEAELVQNRAAVLLFGGSEAQRRAWAERAASSFSAHGPLEVASDSSSLSAALRHENGVVFIPDVLALGSDAQGRIVRCLREQEERPKLVVGLGTSCAKARAGSLLREDLHFALRLGQVDLDRRGGAAASGKKRGKQPIKNTRR